MTGGGRGARGGRRAGRVVGGLARRFYPALAARRGVAVQDIDVVALQDTLRDEGQVLAA
jgi:hypothetical protein